MKYDHYNIIIFQQIKSLVVDMFTLTKVILTIKIHIFFKCILSNVIVFDAEMQAYTKQIQMIYLRNNKSK